MAKKKTGKTKGERREAVKAKKENGTKEGRGKEHAKGGAVKSEAVESYVFPAKLDGGTLVAVSRDGESAAYRKGADYRVVNTDLKGVEVGERSGSVNGQVYKIPKSPSESSWRWVSGQRPWERDDIPEATKPTKTTKTKAKGRKAAKKRPAKLPEPTADEAAEDDAIEDAGVVEEDENDG